MGSCCWRHYRTAHFTGDPGCAVAPGGSSRRIPPFVSPFLHPARKDVDRADPIGMFLEATDDAPEPGLRLPIVGGDVMVVRTVLAGVVRRHGDELPAGPGQLVVSKDLVNLAQRQGAGLRLEDLRGLRQSAKQPRKTKSDAGQNRDSWPFYQLAFVAYKARLAGVAVEKVPAAYTSKTCHACGQLNRRKKQAYRCERCGRQAHADGNAAQNIRDFEGLCCPLVLKAPPDGRHDTALNRVREATGV